MTKYELARRLLTAKNYVFEATMSDYSVASIDRATEQLREVREAVAASPWEESELVEECAPNPYGSVWRILPSLVPEK